MNQQNHKQRILILIKKKHPRPIRVQPEKTLSDRLQAVMETLSISR